jgi:hypothetical protein
MSTSARQGLLTDRFRPPTMPGVAASHASIISVAVPPGVMPFPQTAALVMSAAFEVLAWNDLAAALLEDFATLAPQDRNLARKAFLGPARPDAALYGISNAAPSAGHGLVRCGWRHKAGEETDETVQGIVAEPESPRDLSRLAESPTAVLLFPGAGQSGATPGGKARRSVTGRPSGVRVSLISGRGWLRSTFGRRSKMIT